MSQTTSKSPENHPLDAVTGGAFSAPTSGERAARVREWLATQPATEVMQDVFKELSGRDKGAARPLREKLDEIRRAKVQDALAVEWAEKATALLGQARLNIADALAWQRDAAKAGAPLSREPLAAFKTQLAERIKAAEDLQTRVQVQREAAVLMAQRIDLLSTKGWRDAQAAADVLRNDVAHWQAQADALVADAGWASLDPKFPPLLDASRAQLVAVWEAFSAALAQAVAASGDAQAPLPPVPVWADELRVARGAPPEAAPRAARPKVDPELRARATQLVQEALTRVEQEVAQGHGKASAGAAAALRNALKEHGRLVDGKLEGQAQAALAAAGELEGWQRWRADQLREELVAKAEALMIRPEPVVEAATEAAPGDAAEPAPAATGDATPDAVSEAPDESSGDSAPGHAPGHAPQNAPDTAPDTAAVPRPSRGSRRAGRASRAPAGEAVPRFGGRKMQETLRSLREQWKQVDQGGAPNHALWKRFDEACNEAHKVVEAWLDKVRAESAEHKAQRVALIGEVKAWTEANAANTDWKGINRTLHQFAERWRESGHLSEKAFAEMQPQWKEAISAAHATLEAAQKESVDRRQALIAEATALGAAPMLRIDAVRALQQRWQAEAQSVPLDRKFEQRLWDTFRKPIDDAFNRKTAEREKADSALSERDRTVLEASKALEAASHGGDAQQIKQAMAALDAALQGQAQAVKAAQDAKSAPAEATPDASGPDTTEATDATDATDGAQAPAAPPKAPPKPVVAVRGDDRPGNRKSEPAAPARGGRFGDRKDGPRGDRRDERRGPPGADRNPRFDGRDAREDRGPRLGDAAFRAQREAVERAQMALRKLSAQAHGEALVQLMGAWEKRAADQLPGVAELGRAVPPATRQAWAQALGAAQGGDSAQSLLRLEMAAEVPTPAEHISARRMLQLQLLTKRNDPGPAQTWGQDVGTVLSAPYDAESARRLQNALKALLRG